jgi:hypothetical protein
MTDTTKKAMTLERCPFCGKPAEIVDDYNESDAWFNLGCSDEKCVAHNFVYGQNIEWRDETIAAWNKRALPHPRVEVTDEMVIRARMAYTGRNRESIEKDVWPNKSMRAALEAALGEKS